MFFEFFSKIFEKKSISPLILAGGRLNFWLGGQIPPRTLRLNGRPQHLIEAAKRGRLDQMLFISAPLTIRAPLTARALLTAPAPLTTVRRPEAKFTSAACRMQSFNFLQPSAVDVDNENDSNNTRKSFFLRPCFFQFYESNHYIESKSEDCLNFTFCTC